MTPARHRAPVRALMLAALASALLLLLVAADRAAAYSKPAGGRWVFYNLFDDTKRGALSLSRSGSKVAKLVLVPGEDEIGSCGKAAIRLKSRPRVRSYRKVNGRYAVARLPKRLFQPTPMVFKQGKRSFRAKLTLLWDETGRMVTTGDFKRGGCQLRFYAHKTRKR